MDEKFDVAALRHYGDAGTLAASQRFDGAGHLIGFCAECAVKHAIINLRSDISSLHGHFPELINIAKRHLNLRSHHGLYTVLKNPDFMKGWVVGNRYSADGAIDKKTYELWRGHARSLMFAAKLKGLL